MRRLTREHTIPVDQRHHVLTPAITIDPGETVVVETINHMTPVVYTEAELHPHGSPEYREREETGPISVRGAEPGDMLAIHIKRIDIVGLPHAHASGPLVDRYPQRPLLFPVQDGECRLPGGVCVPVSPMIGDIYTTPDSTLDTTYIDHGGNMDFTEVKPGNTLYLPVFREGGLLVLGDVHALQGDGEIYGEAAECAADVTLSIDVDTIHRSARPVVETPDSLICMAGASSLFESIRLAVEDMTKLLARLHSLSERDAYIFSTMVGSVRMAGCVASQRWVDSRVLIGLSVPKNFGLAP